MYLKAHQLWIHPRLNNNLVSKISNQINRFSSTLLVFLFLLFTSFINAQVAVTATAENMGQSVSTLSVPFTVAAGSDRLLLVTVGGNEPPSSVMFGTTSMSQVATSTTYTLVLGTNVISESETITVTTAAAGALLALNAIAFTGVDQTTPVDNPIEMAIAANATTSSMTITSKVNDLVFDGVIVGCLGFGCGPLTLAEDAGQTMQNDIATSSIFGAGLGKTSTKPGATSVNVGWTISGAGLGGTHTGINVRSSLPLPVELASFKAQQLKEEVVLSWETLSETNNRAFEIEKSIDGNTYEKIGSVSGHGTTSETKRYRFTDKSPSENVLYYRLKQIDFDGQFEYSKVEVVNFIKDEFLIYPNPVVDKIFIKIPYQGNSKINVYNSTGILLQEYTIDSDDISLDLSNLPKGIFYLEIYNNHQVYFEKISKY